MEACRAGPPSHGLNPSGRERITRDIRANLPVLTGNIAARGPLKTAEIRPRQWFCPPFRQFPRYSGYSNPCRQAGRRFGRGPGPPIHRDKSGGLLDPLQPCPDRREGRQVEVAAVGDVGVAVERDVGDGELLGGEVGVPLEVIFHHLQRSVAALHPVLQRVRLQVAPALDQRQPEIGGADVRLQRVLFEEHPLQRLGALDPRFRRQRRADRDIPEDSVGLGEVAAFGDLEQRHLAAWILGQEVRGAALAAQDVDLDRLVWRVQQGQRQPDLVAVAGALHRIELVHCVGVHSVRQVHLVWDGTLKSCAACHTATPLNNDADRGASQALQCGKSRNVYRTARAQNDSINTAEQLGSRLRDAVHGAGPSFGSSAKSQTLTRDATVSRRAGRASRGTVGQPPHCTLSSEQSALTLLPGSHSGRPGAHAIALAGYELFGFGTCGILRALRVVRESFPALPPSFLRCSGDRPRVPRSHSNQVVAQPLTTFARR